MKYWPLTVHLELHFTSLETDPCPWWRPFFWARHPWEKTPEGFAVKENGFVVRTGALGLHLCVALHFYDDTP